MASPRRRLAAVLAIALPGFLVGLSVQFSLAVLASSTAVGSNTFTTAAEWDTVAPTVSATVIAKTGQYLASYVKQGGSYYVYASATDAGTPTSGIATITADVSAITTGQTAVPLAAGSYTVEGVTYGYRSASVTVDASLSAGSKSYTLTSTDNWANSRFQTGYTVTVDNTAATGSDIQCVNGGATVGTVELGDVCTFTFSEIIDPESILAGWTGTSANVVVRITNTGSSDHLAVWNAANTSQLNLGSVNMKGNYVTTDVTAGTIGTASTMVLNAAARTITVTLGTIAGSVVNDSNNNTSAWSPSASAFDRAGNAMSTTTANESGTADKDF